jgi:hypothetical protein
LTAQTISNVPGGTSNSHATLPNIWCIIKEKVQIIHILEEWARELAVMSEEVNHLKEQQPLEKMNNIDYPFDGSPPAR